MWERDKTFNFMLLFAKKKKKREKIVFITSLPAFSSIASIYYMERCDIFSFVVIRMMLIFFFFYATDKFTIEEFPP